MTYQRERSSPARQIKTSLYLDVERSALDLRRALLDDKRDPIWTVLRCLCKVDAKQVKSALQLFMAALDGKCFQTLLMAGQRALGKERRQKQSVKNVYHNVYDDTSLKFLMINICHIQTW